MKNTCPYCKSKDLAIVEVDYSKGKSKRKYKIKYECTDCNKVFEGYYNNIPDEFKKTGV